MADPVFIDRRRRRRCQWMARFSWVGIIVTLLVLISQLYQYRPAPHRRHGQRPVREVFGDYETHCSWWDTPMRCASVETRLARFTADQVRHATNILALIQDSGLPPLRFYLTSPVEEAALNLSIVLRSPQPGLADDFDQLNRYTNNALRLFLIADHKLLFQYQRYGCEQRSLSTPIAALHLAQEYRSHCGSGLKLSSPQCESTARQAMHVFSALGPNLVQSLNLCFNSFPRHLDPFIERSKPMVRSGEMIMAKLEAEMDHLNALRKDLPFYDNWFIYWAFRGFRRSQTLLLEEDLVTMNSGMEVARRHTEAMRAIKDNMEDVRYYIYWYNATMDNSSPGYHPSGLRTLNEEVATLDELWSHLIRETDFAVRLLHQSQSDTSIPRRRQLESLPQAPSWSSLQF
ncbi:hypothetical protein JAAARDRAFT_72828 [Jaapia argillacea MUCL 33604]|uniref:Uncharacterized protein n=1 Tax=Jaapia argillacea MUCL 33604 TaxID=933084 RepID=A0A067PNC8_9AGAM|nr:hypothetical protein JAAARDRAFT_72828 [Jaapia argillacea MUCL 33604]